MVKKHVAYIPLGGGYSYAPLRIGLSLLAPSGQEVYFQPGDDESAIREVFTALDEVSLDPSNPLRTRLATIALGEYFN